MFRYVAALVIVALSCSVGWAEKPTKLTKANYERIKVGQTVQAVTDILGKENARLKDTPAETVLAWNDGLRLVFNVTFKNGRVIGKAYSGTFEEAASGATSKSKSKSKPKGNGKGKPIIRPTR